MTEEFFGNIYASADAVGTNDVEGFVSLDKRGDATVLRAYLMAQSNFDYIIEDGDVQLDGREIVWDDIFFNDAGAGRLDFFNNVYADVTDIVRPVVDASPAGLIDFRVTENNTTFIDGVTLFVIFEDSSLPEQSILMYIGGQSTRGDTFNLSLPRPLQVSEDDLTMGLGISFGFQGTSGTPMLSEIDVNGVRLTTSAGGEDDGESADGALITVGGIGDSLENPDPFATPSPNGLRTDDELYNLATVVGDGTTSIAISTINPTDDDNIFFAYFVISGNSEGLPVVSQPETPESRGVLNPNLPTIVLTHGLQSSDQTSDQLWSGFGPGQAGALINESLGLGVANVIQYVWPDAFQSGLVPRESDYLAAREKTFNAGIALRKLLVDRLGSDYDQSVHFVGHSLGAIVNSYAAASLRAEAPNVETMQFTALERPDRVSAILGIDEDDENELGFNSAFFAAVLPLDDSAINFRLDNFYSLNGQSTGDKATGPRIYNHPALVRPNDISSLLFANEGTGNNHSAVQQWYRWSMTPNTLTLSEFCSDGGIFNKPDFVDASLNPCDVGWFWSLNQNPERFPEFNGQEQDRVITRLVFNNIAERGCIANSQTRFTCTEQSSPFLSADIELEDDQEFISFDYEFTQLGDGDYAAVMLDNKVFWVLSDSIDSFATGNTGPLQIPVKNRNPRIKVALYSVGETNAEIEFSNFEAISSPDPEPVSDAGYSYDLANRQWEQLVIPADAQSLTIESLFGDVLNADNYGFSWRIFTYDGSQELYEDPGLNGTLLPGQGFWMIQIESAEVTIEIPRTLPPVTLVVTDACVSDDGCVEVPLSPLPQTFPFVMVGAPFPTTVDTAGVRLRSAGDSTDCVSGCTTDEAVAAGYIAQLPLSMDMNDLSILTRYEPSSGSYVALDKRESLQPMNGFWLKSEPGAAGNDLKIVFSDGN
ncbi:MAG: hypothetical protein AB8B64_00495 [Granulosicoccus sp.]